MSKMDNLRAMREARYQEMAARSAKAPAPARRPVAPPATSPAKAEPEAAASADALCGHRNMGGKTCTREQGHAAKSHRYS